MRMSTNEPHLYPSGLALLATVPVLNVEAS